MPPTVADMPPPITLPFKGAKLRAMRELRGLEQRQLADLLGIAQWNLSKYENKKRKPSVEMFTRFVEVLGCTPEDLLDYEDPDYPVGVAA
jgi:transcriptional regulator with XRE-family HTH domain